MLGESGGEAYAAAFRAVAALGEATARSSRTSTSSSATRTTGRRCGVSTPKRVASWRRSGRPLGAGCASGRSCCSTPRPAATTIGATPAAATKRCPVVLVPIPVLRPPPEDRDLRGGSAPRAARKRAATAARRPPARRRRIARRAARRGSGRQAPSRCWCSTAACSRRSCLPELVSRHFGEHEPREFEVAVVGMSSHRPIVHSAEIDASSGRCDLAALGPALRGCVRRAGASARRNRLRRRPAARRRGAAGSAPARAGARAVRRLARRGAPPRRADRRRGGARANPQPGRQLRHPRRAGGERGAAGRVGAAQPAAGPTADRLRRGRLARAAHAGGVDQRQRAEPGRRRGARSRAGEALRRGDPRRGAPLERDGRPGPRVRGARRDRSAHAGRLPRARRRRARGDGARLRADRPGGRARRRPEPAGGRGRRRRAAARAREPAQQRGQVRRRVGHGGGEDRGRARAASCCRSPTPVPASRTRNRRTSSSPSSAASRRATGRSGARGSASTWCGGSRKRTAAASILDSAPGSGSRFTIELPAASPKAAPSLLGSSRVQKRILLVEDEPALSMSLADRLAHEGYAVEAVADGETGLRAGAARAVRPAAARRDAAEAERPRRAARAAAGAASRRRC